MLPAAELVAPALLAGPGYRVEARAEVRGYQARFRLHTPWGELQAESVEMLAIRVGEMPALEALYSESVGETLRASGLEAVAAPVKAIANVASHPVQSVVGLPQGVLRYFGERLSKLGAQARKLGHRIDERISHEGSPYQEVDGPLAATRDPTPAEDRPWWDKPARELGRLIKNEAGYGKARREIAERLGVDPYTSNPLLKERLDALAWAASSGKLGINQALALATGGASEVLGYVQQVDRLVLTMAPEDVRARNEDQLARVCADEELRYAFLHKGTYTPTLQTALVDLLVGLRPAGGCEAFLETALMAASEVEARFVVNSLRLLDHYLRDEAHGGHFVPVGALPAYLTRGGEFVLPLPVDYLSWTPQIRQWFDRPGIGDRRYRTLLVSGRLSPRSERMLTRRGWSLVPHVRYAGAPPYVASPVSP
ncbi:hypothetical protein [Rehaibacterium terrae]|uniref:hypothetical protein n=1 Tax=Rehaibacterium terrae TaxID=1341696 RepID=UPI00391DCD71